MVEELYQGVHDSDEDFSYQLADDLGLVPEGNDWPTSYIDWNASARDLMMDYRESDGHYFRTSYRERGLLSDAPALAGVFVLTLYFYGVSR